MKKLKSAQDAITQAIEGGYDFEKKEHDGLKPPLNFVRCEFEIQAEHLKQGGYLMVRALYEDAHGKEYGSWVVFDDLVKRYQLRYLTDPLFWQALGKARGWGNVVNGSGDYQTKTWGDWFPLDSWGWFAHQWFETRLSNGDETKFWESLP